MAGLVNQGPMLRGVTTGPLPRQQGHLALTGVLVGNEKLVAVMRQAPKTIVSAALRVSVQRAINVAKDSIKSHAERIPSHRSFGVFSRSLGTSFTMQSRFQAVGVVGNKRDYREYAADPGPRGSSKKKGVRKTRGRMVRPSTGLRVVNQRRPAKYWHFVEYGVYGGRGHHLVLRAVLKAMPRIRTVIEAASVEVLARHFKVPPLIMSAAIHAQKV